VDFHWIELMIGTIFFVCFLENRVKWSNSEKSFFYDAKPSNNALGRVGTELGGDRSIFICLYLFLGFF
jgi:hypothetical protein